MLVSGTNGINVNAGATDVVILNGLEIQGRGSGLIGISFNTGAALHVENCRISGFRTSPATGILFAPPGGATSTLFVSNTMLTENSTGVLIKPSGGAAIAVIDHSYMNNNAVGLEANGTGGTGNVQVTLSNSVTSGNTSSGTHAISSSAKTFIIVTRSASTNNGTGFLAEGGGSAISLKDSVALYNTTGVNAMEARASSAIRTTLSRET